MTEMQKRPVIAAFLDKHAIEDEIDKHAIEDEIAEELDMSGWTEALVDELTDVYVYDDDVLAIQRIPGVTLIAP